LEGGDIPLPFCCAFSKIFGSQQKPEGETEAPNLNEPEPDGQEDSRAEEQHECLGPPNEGGYKPNDSLENTHLIIFFVFPLPLDLLFDVLVQGEEVITGQAG
jgi:hypothetical protein